MKIRRIISAFLLVLLLASCAVAAKKSYPLSPNRLYAVKVTRVVDGDTIIVEFENGASERVRLIGVNTPESVDPNRPIEYYGKEASKYTKKTLSDKVVILHTDVGTRDKYGRALGYIWMSAPEDRKSKAEVRAKMFNARLLLDGYAQTMTIQPNSAYAGMFAGFQHEARKQGKGLWGKQQHK